MLAPRVLDQFAHPVALVLAQIVQPDDLARLERRGQHVLDVRFEAAGGHRLIQDQPGPHPLQRERGDGRAIRPVIPRARWRGPAPRAAPGQCGRVRPVVLPNSSTQTQRAGLDRRGELPPGFAGPARPVRWRVNDFFFASSRDPE